MIPGKSFTDKKIEKIKGKTYSKVNMGQRKPFDDYSTPYSMTQQYLDCEYISKGVEILEPAAGRGAIVEALMQRGYNCITAGDLKWGYDFLNEDRVFSYVLTNPPYSLAHEFIDKCMDVTARKFALLLPITYISGQKRFHDFFQYKKYPFFGTYTFTRMPMLGDPLRPDGKYRTGMTVYAWYVWDRTWGGEPVHRWIDNNQYVLGKDDKYCKDCHHCVKLSRKKKYLYAVTCRKGNEGRISISVCGDYKDRDKYADFEGII